MVASYIHSPGKIFRMKIKFFENLEQTYQVLKLELFIMHVKLSENAFFMKTNEG